MGYQKRVWRPNSIMEGETSDYTRDLDGGAAAYSTDPKPQEMLAANIKDIENMLKLNGKENDIMRQQILMGVSAEECANLSQPFGKFQFIDYGKKEGIPSGLETLLRQFTVDKFDQCNGERAAIILYGGSGAGKTKNTEAIIGKMDELFAGSQYKMQLSITE